MRRVITASLNGNAYQLEEDAHALLEAYLAHAADGLRGNPDRDEILADVEQAIADKCQRYLAAHRTVLGATEIRTILDEMGPVDGDGVAPGPAPTGAAATGGTTDSASEPPPRRLYQISDGALVSGVCNGLAAYFHVDVTFVRLAFVLLLFLSAGTALLGYVVLMFVVPYAETPEQKAAAHGLPFNARTLVEKAKRSASEFAEHRAWRDSGADWRQKRRAWRAHWRERRAEWRARWHAGAMPPEPPPAHPVPWIGRMLAGFVIALITLVMTLITGAWLIVLISLLTTGAFLGFLLPIGLPIWIVVIVGLVLLGLVQMPLKALRRAAWGGGAGYYGPWVSFWDGLVGLAVLVLIAWYAFHHVGPVHELGEHLRNYWQGSDWL